MLRTRWCRRFCIGGPESRSRRLGKGWSHPSCWRRLWLRPDPTLSCCPPPPPSNVCLRNTLQSQARCCSGWSAPDCWEGLIGFSPPGRWCDKETPTGRGRLCLGQGSPLRQLGGHRRERLVVCGVNTEKKLDHKIFNSTTAKKWDDTQHHL